MKIEHHPRFNNFFEVHHPLILHKLSMMRAVATNKQEFKKLTEEISTLLVYEVTRGLEITDQLIQTPLEVASMPVLSGKKPVVLAILRAGLGMIDGFLNLMPSVRIGHIGLYRDEKTLKPHYYYFKIPKRNEDRQFYICDPMLATGGTAVYAIDKLKEQGVNKIIFVCILASPEGVKKVLEAHPDVPIFAAKLDRELNSQGYILPGLGDAGDRLFGTK